MNRRSGRKCRGAAATLLVLAISTAPHAAAQPSPDVGPFYAFGGDAWFGTDSNDQRRGEGGGEGRSADGGYRFLRLLSFVHGLPGVGFEIRSPLSAPATHT